MLRPSEAIWFHVPNQQGTRSLIEMCRLKGLGVLPGVSDIVIVTKSVTLFIEIKSKRGTLSNAQREIQRRCCQMGIPYAICRSLDDVISFIKLHQLSRHHGSDAEGDWPKVSAQNA
ncbi:VRR-NUC domain-containing protein [Patescibacteria group bacterium]|nr:VRR-NUC domain-containing protein [Patescibacteria group bacterium]